jgi:glycosyltransferase involved in cell wall biosynthesis
MFSVIIPLYNKAPYIEKAIRSVAAQTCQEFELIVIDDGSQDDPLPPKGGNGLQRLSFLENCLEFLEKVRIVEQKNQGVSVTRNNGVELAKYDYIAFLDADDWWAPTYLEEMKALIAQYPEAGIYGSSYFKVKNGKHIQANIGVGEGFQQGLINYFQVYAKTLWMPLWTGATVIKKSIFNEQNGFKPTLKLGEDFDLWVRVALKYPVAFLNKPLAYYNQDVEQSSRGVVDEKIYNPSEFITFNLDFLVEEERVDFDVKTLLDRLRVYSLLRYKIQGEYKDMVKKVISGVDFNNVERKYYFFSRHFLEH